MCRRKSSINQLETEAEKEFAAFEHLIYHPANISLWVLSASPSRGHPDACLVQPAKPRGSGRQRPLTQQSLTGACGQLACLQAGRAEGKRVTSLSLAPRGLWAARPCQHRPHPHCLSGFSAEDTPQDCSPLSLWDAPPRQPLLCRLLSLLHPTWPSRAALGGVGQGQVSS